jgi:endonuclease/exonuclease/phosphatase family metal-dependent hydrolase
VIRASGAEVACLQEVERRLPQSRFADQPKQLGEQLGMTSVFQRNLRIGPGAFGNLILSSYPVIEAKSFSLTSGREQRGLLMARIDALDGPISIFCTHWGLSADERVQQAIEAAEIIKNTPQPVIFCGDLNETSEKSAVTTLLSSSGLHDLSLEAGQTPPTYPSDVSTARIDYILGSSELHGITSEVIESPASDHLLVVVDVTC